MPRFLDAKRARHHLTTWLRSVAGAPIHRLPLWLAVSLGSQVLTLNSCVIRGTSTSPGSPVTTPNPVPAGQSALPCPGTAPNVYENCGCNPIDARLLARVAALQFNDRVRNSITTCFNAVASTAPTADPTHLGGNVETCISRRETLDPTLREVIASLVREAASATPPTELSSWLRCYNSRVDPCAAAVGCGECTSGSSCGWCASESRCARGTDDGPLVGGCGGGWTWTPGACPDNNCAHFTTCRSCSSATACGWCSLNGGSCLPGDGEGPLTATCAGGWSWLPNQCVDSGRCARITNCANCAAASGCGWCGADGTCRAGDANGSVGPACPSGWTNRTQFCPDREAHCASYSGCAECMGQVGCGWCGGTRECHAGSLSGPVTGTCASRWSQEVATCPDVEPQCNARQGCEQCASAPNCGWCASDSRCHAGTSGGDFARACRNGWTWQPSACLSVVQQCAAQSDCQSCTALPRCGWCSGGRCSSGSSRGPVSGSCEGTWSWQRAECGNPPTAPAPVGDAGPVADATATTDATEEDHSH